MFEISSKSEKGKDTLAIDKRVAVLTIRWFTIYPTHSSTLKGCYAARTSLCKLQSWWQ
jgi:hypothetical protein